jgi:hypothetical protein
VRSRPVSGLLVSLILTLLISGCGGPSPETRARQTRTALRGTSTPIPPPPSPTGIDHERAAILTAEAFLPVATVVPATVSPILVATIAATREAVTTKSELTEVVITGAMARQPAGADRGITASDRASTGGDTTSAARGRP